MRDELPDSRETDAAGDDCQAGARNRFFRGKHMKAEDFEREQHYAIGRRRLITRAVLGWGVVYGLPVTGPRARPDVPDEYRPPEQDDYTKKDPDPSYEPPKPQPGAGPIGVGGGLALDRHGREISVFSPVVLNVKNTFVVEEGASGCKVRSIDTLAGGRYVLSIHYAERRFGDANLPDNCGCDGPEKKYVCETAVFSLRAFSGRECPCAEGPCARECKCGAPSTCGGAGRGPHSCLCQWVTDGTVVTDTPALCEWRGYWIDPSDGVPLACVTVHAVDDKCGPSLAGSVDDDCSTRRLVKSNDLLYDLIRGCDLTRIDWISWHTWHRSRDQMPWHTFEDMFQEDGITAFVVRFSGPVRAETLDRDVVAMAAVTTEQSTGWRVARRVPIVGLDLTPDPEHLGGHGALPPGTTNQMRVKVRPEWVRDEIERGRESWLSERDFRLEIEVHGDFILDCHGQAIDANAVGLRPVPTGNGAPGGTFRSNFRVERKQRKGSYDAA